MARAWLRSRRKWITWHDIKPLEKYTTKNSPRFFSPPLKIVPAMFLYSSNIISLSPFGCRKGNPLWQGLKTTCKICKQCLVRTVLLAVSLSVVGTSSEYRSRILLVFQYQYQKRAVVRWPGRSIFELIIGNANNFTAKLVLEMVEAQILF